MENKNKPFNGEGDVKEFITKVELNSALKGYTAEKCAQNLASRLEGPAFDVYLRLNETERKDVNKLKQELMKEFERGQQNREDAIAILSNRTRRPGEAAHTYAYKIAELVKLAYPTFDEITRSTIAKDYFVKGLHPEMQRAVKSMEKFMEYDISKLASEITRLQLAGIKSKFEECHAVNPVDPVNVNNGKNSVSEDVVGLIADKVVDKLTKMSLSSKAGGSELHDSEVNFTAANFNGYRPRFGRGRSNQRYQPRQRGRFHNAPAQQLKCRCCQSTDHLVRNCPSRFCQACGQRGHDSSDKNCTKYQ